MQAHRTLPLFVVAACAGLCGPALAQDAMGWQDQRYSALQAPGRSLPVLRQLDRDHDMGRRSGEEIRLGHGLTVRDGRAYLFQGRSDDFPIARFSGAVDGHGVHLIMSWPP